jgi:hypothetical protein
MTSKYIVAWDFSKKASGSFYRLLTDECGTSHAGGDYELIQKSVALCRDDFVASRVAALAEHFGAKVNCFGVQREGIDASAREEAAAFVDRILYQRRHRQGRHHSKLKAKTR